MSNVIVIADDLTGANDTGVQFSKVGIPTTVLLDGKALRQRSPDFKVSVLNTDTRAMDERAAYEQMSQLATNLSLNEDTLVYKKIDSTMRGNVGIEIDALMDHLDFDLCVVAPAYPENGRTTIGGYHLIRDQLLEDSEISRDPKFPVTKSYLPDIIDQQSGRKIGHIEIRSIRGGMLLQEVEKGLAAGEKIFTFDSAIASDLKTVTDELFTSKYKVLWVGSAGMAYPFSKLIDNGQSKTDNDFEYERSPELPTLIVAGSVSAVTREQISFLKKEGVQLIALDPISLFTVEENSLESIEEFQTAKELLTNGSDLCITTMLSEEKKAELANYVEKNNISDIEAGNAIAKGIGRFASALLKTISINGVVLTGGDIAYQTLNQLEINELKVISEVEEGIPHCKVIGGPYHNLSVITKAGAFGKKSSLLTAMQSMK